MADDADGSEQLVEQIADAAADLNLQYADIFRDIALDNLASFRDQQRTDDRSGSLFPDATRSLQNCFLSLMPLSAFF
jgi:hypothetical protein